MSENKDTRSAFVVPGTRQKSGPRRKRADKSAAKISNKSLALIAGLLAVVCVLMFTLRFLVHPRTSQPGNTLTAAGLGTTGAPGGAATGSSAGAAGTGASTGGPSNGGTSATAAMAGSEHAAGSGGTGPNVDSAPELKPKTKELPGNEKGVMFHATLSSDSRCHIGDIDVIRQELTYSPGSKLLVTIEPLFPSVDPGPPTSREIVLERILTGARLSLFVPRGEGVRHLGFFVCKDSTGDGKCANKEIADLNRVYETYFPFGSLERKPPEYRASDKVYFFQYIMLDNDTMTAFDNSATAKNPALLEQFLANKLGSAIQAREVSDRVALLNKEIRSVPLTISGSYLYLDLPHLDSSACAVAGPRVDKEALDEIRKRLFEPTSADPRKP